MEVNRRFTSLRPLPPMLSPPRTVTCVVSPTKSGCQSVTTADVVLDDQDALDSDTQRRMKRLSMVVTAIHRKREEEEKLKSKQSYHQLFPESRLSEKENQSFSYYRLRRNSFDDDHEGVVGEKPRNRSREFRFEHPDDSVSRRVHLEIVRFEEERKTKVEQSILKRKERLNALVSKLREASIAKLEERLSSIYMEEENINRSLERDADGAEDRLLCEQRRLRDEHERRQREREARLQAAEIAAKAAAAKEQAIQEQFEELQRQEAEKEKARLHAEEQRQSCLAELKESLTHFEQLIEKTRELIDQNSLRLLLDQYGLDLAAVDDAIGGEAEFDADFVQGSKVALNEVTEMIESKLREMEDSREKYEREEREKSEREKAERERLEKEKAERGATANAAGAAVEAVGEDQVSSANWHRFSQLKQFKQNTNIEVQALLNDKEAKSFTFLCMKAVNTPVNAIGRTTAAHLMDKVKKLVSLLRGETIEVQDNQFSAAAHPLGIKYCKSLLAAKLVKQGEEVVRAQPKDAFTVASVVVALWSEFPDFGNLFLATLYETCPFLIPCFFGRQPGMTDEDYYRRLGYNYDAANRVEDQVTYESRMGGVARLYAAIMVSTLPKESLKAKRDHPHGVGNAWNLIASTLNLKPDNGVVTTILVNVVEVCGHALFDRYKTQFRQLLHVVASDYFNLMKACSLEASRNRLEMVLEKAITTGSLKQADGMLNVGYF